MQNAQNDILKQMSKSQLTDFYNQATKGAESIPRVNEGGKISGRTVNSSPAEKAAATELSNIPNYNPSATNLETHDLIHSEISKSANELRVSLQNEGQVIPKKEIISTTKK